MERADRIMVFGGGPTHRAAPRFLQAGVTDPHTTTRYPSGVGDTANTRALSPHLLHAEFTRVTREGCPNFGGRRVRPRNRAGTPELCALLNQDSARTRWCPLRVALVFAEEWSLDRNSLLYGHLNGLSTRG